MEAAQRHPAAVVKRQQDRDLGVLLGALGPVSERQLELFFLIQTFIARFKPESTSRITVVGGEINALSRLSDADVADAAGALAASFETAHRGVLYEHQATSPLAEGLRRDLKGFVGELVGRGGARIEREAVDVLRGIERGARHETLPPDAGPRDYLTIAARIVQEHRREPTAAPAIIVP